MAVILTQIPRAWPSINGRGKVFVMMLIVTTVVGIVLGIPPITAIGALIVPQAPWGIGWGEASSR